FLQAMYSFLKRFFSYFFNTQEEKKGEEICYSRSVCVRGAFYGKIYDYMLTKYPDQFSSVVPLTSRARRNFEVNGYDYYFVSENFMREFEVGNEFIEIVTSNGSQFGLTIGGV
ncbi:hypothetical protein PFISCL1PPCAC_26091, partial [Pristionchus fissidentatus]